MAQSATSDELTQCIDALLPQTQCRQCGYSGCKPYAEALAAGNAEINRCPPGGSEVIEELARLLARTAKPLDATCGVTKAPAVAIIDEAWCIGCTLCIQACPVDAIAGAAKVMHTVIADVCTGCELCIPPCPVDCIRMVAVARPGDRANDKTADKTAQIARAAQARSRYLARNKRIATRKRQAQRSVPSTTATAHNHSKQSAVARAMARARERINGDS